MKVNELRTVLGKYKPKELQEIAVALYKMIPKAKKEENDVDELLQNFTLEKPKQAKKESHVDFNQLDGEIAWFLACADEQLFLAPNRIVPKSRRTKWRFEVKNFVKNLLAVSGENSDAAAKHMVNIYNMLSYACNYYIFTSENPITAIGYRQTELLGIVLGKLFYSGYSEEAIKTAVYTTLDSNVDRFTLHTSLHYVLINSLKTPDTKETALKYCIEFPKDYYTYQSVKKIFKISGRSYSSSSTDYRYNGCRNNAAELYLLIKFSLQEYDEGIKYFWKNTIERDKEVKLYCLLELIGMEELDQLWLREYDKAVKSGIKPRESLQEEYSERKAAN